MTLAGFRATLAAAVQNATDWQSAHPIQQAKLADLRDGLARLEPSWPKGLGHKRAAALGRALALGAGQSAARGAGGAARRDAGAAWDLIDGLGDACRPMKRRISASTARCAWPRCAPSCKSITTGPSTPITATPPLRAVLVYLRGKAGAAPWRAVRGRGRKPRVAARYRAAGGGALAGFAGGGRRCPAGPVPAGASRASPDRAPRAEHRAPPVRGNPRQPDRAEMLPIDLLRCKLAFFGATRFDPRSDRWVRISLFQGAPYPDDLTPGDAP